MRGFTLPPAAQLMTLSVNGLEAPPPIMHLMAHATELALKSYLRHRGYTVEQLSKRPYGHDLRECMKAAIDCGLLDYLALTEADQTLFKLISEHHASHELRYIKIGVKTYPVLGPFDDLVSKILLAVSRAIAYRHPRHVKDFLQWNMNGAPRRAARSTTQRIL